ncbi:MAG: glycerate kinase family protein [Rhizobiaceae bacterium]
MTLNILIAPSGFKESLDVNSVTDNIEKGIRRIMPDVIIRKVPMVDGGEGFVEAIVTSTNGIMKAVTVTGPVGQKVRSFYGLMGGNGKRTAVIEMAAAAGLSLVPRDQRNPMLTTSHGVGELISYALSEGVERILLGCGDSGINDGGMGMVRALGGRFLDADGNEVAEGGGALVNIARIDLSNLDPRLRSVQIDAAVNHHNMLLGPRGVARVFAPQKGATPEQVVHLEAGLINYATRIYEDTGIDVSTLQGGGASGGLGTGLAALLGGKLHPRFQIVMEYLQFEESLEGADLVVTAEGSLDGQTPFGKVPAEVARRARALGIPVIALAGTLGKDVHLNLDEGIDAFASIMERPCSLDQAIEEAEMLLQHAARDAMRMVCVGLKMRANIN